jgi:hypothetical protein
MFIELLVDQSCPQAMVIVVAVAYGDCLYLPGDPPFLA